MLLAEWHPSMRGLDFGPTMYWALTKQGIAARRFDPVRVTMYANP